jgi:hypothetical protein
MCEIGHTIIDELSITVSRGEMEIFYSNDEILNHTSRWKDHVIQMRIKHIPKVILT